MGKTRDLFKKIRDTKGTFNVKMGTIKDRNGMDLKEAEDIKKKWQEYTDQIRSVAQSCPTLCNPVDCGPPGSSDNTQKNYTKKIFMTQITTMV